MRPVLLLLVATGCFDKRVEEAYDRDRDGFPTWEIGGPDCDDDNAAVHPGAPEVCGNGLDDDCSGFIDDAGVGSAVFYVDQDRDGFPGSSPQSSCEVPEGGYLSLAIGADCDDADPTRSPGATEVWYDGVDQNCDGNDADADGDGWAGGPEGEDCDDGDRSVNPGALEVCNNGVDDDCDGGAGRCAMEGVVDASEVVVETFGQWGRLMSVDWPGLDDPAVVIWREDAIRVFGERRVAGALQPEHEIRLPPLPGELFFDYADVTGDGLPDFIAGDAYRIYAAPAPVTDLFVNVSDLELLLEDPTAPVLESGTTGVVDVAGPGVLVAGNSSNGPTLTHLPLSGSWPADGTQRVDLASGSLAAVGPVHGLDSEAVLIAEGGVAYSLSWDTLARESWGPVSPMSTVSRFEASTGTSGAAPWLTVYGISGSSPAVSLIQSSATEASVWSPEQVGVTVSSTDSALEFGATAVCDLDGDGTDDLVVGHKTSDTTRPWLRGVFGLSVLFGPWTPTMDLSDADVFVHGAGMEAVVCLQAFGGHEGPVLVVSDSYVGNNQILAWRGQ